MKQFLSLILLVVALTGCGQVPTPEKTENTTQASSVVSDKQSEVVTVTLFEEGKEIESKEIPIKTDELLGDVMADNFDVLEENGMIVSINGKKQDVKENKYWLYDVNGKFAEVGANQYKLSPEDQVVWKLDKLEMETSESE